MRLIFSALVGVSLSMALFKAAPALAADITLDSAVLATSAKGKITFKTVALTDCNLSYDEATSLFSGSLPREEAGALLERMTAKTLKIPEADILAENGDQFVLRDITVENIAKGGAEKISLASIEGVLPDDSGDATLHSGPLRLESVALPGLAAALRGGDIGLAALRFAHLSWDGGDVSTVDKGTAAGVAGGNRILLHAGASHVDQTLDADGAPISVDAQFSGLSMKMPPQSKGGATLSAFGYAEITGDAHFSGAYEAPAKTYRLADYSLDLQKIGKISVSGQFSALEKSAFTGDKPAREAAMHDATVDWVQFPVINSGIFEKVVAFTSLSQGRSPDAIKAEWRGIVSQAPMLFSGAPAIAAAAKAADRFILDPKTLTLRVKGKYAPLKVEDLVHVADPMGFINRLDIDTGPNSEKSVSDKPTSARP
jgi:hypothetical protein